MRIELTAEQVERIQEADKNEPLRAFNPQTKQAFILVPTDVYERLQFLIEERFDPREAYPLVDRIMAEDDANDPCLETYQQFRREDRQ
jgi:hypothetical protein